MTMYTTWILGLGFGVWGLGFRFQAFGLGFRGFRGAFACAIGHESFQEFMGVSGGGGLRWTNGMVLAFACIFRMNP